MNRKQIVEMGEQAGIFLPSPPCGAPPLDRHVDAVARLIALATAAERERCLAEVEQGIWVDKTVDEILASIADAIRSGGQSNTPV